ncbi:response regulator [Caldimonas tepidiphila]|uniref:response regulator n=1 Tax=Caldimonas tepidiphila TaxID=2315841 RepID=UPI001300270A|nr:response regulator [Caldimonas tepidiphila]
MRRILIVDDEFSNLEALELILSEEGYGVTVASDGRQALEKLEDAVPDLVLTDHMMPVMNGAQLIQALRSDPRHQAIPILLMSGAPESVLRPLTTAYDAFLRKPFDIDALLQRIKMLLEGAPARKSPGT